MAIQPGPGVKNAAAISRAKAILQQDRKWSHRIGYMLSPWLRGAGMWLVAAVAYDLVTGQYPFLPWHSVKARWDGLIDASWWRDVRHLIRGLPEGALFGIEKARGKNPVKRRRRKEYREQLRRSAGETPYSKKRLSGLVAASILAGVGALVGTVAGGYLVIHVAETAAIAPHLSGFYNVFHQVGSFFSKPIPVIGKPLPSALRDAFSLSSPQEDVGRVAGITSHTAARSFTRGARKARFERMVQGFTKQIQDGALDRSQPWRGQGAAIHEAAERIAAGLA